MTPDAQRDAIRDAFAARFGAEPAATAFAPGRVNLLGEHTDYNGGYVLPMALEGFGVAVAIDASAPAGQVLIRSETLNDDASLSIDAAPSGAWSDYALGCLKALASGDIAQRGARLALATSVPMGAGLSSSAALEVAVLRAASALFGRPLDPKTLALMAQRVENEFVGMPCGVMDQFAASAGRPGEAILLDTHSLAHRPAPHPAGARLLIVHSGATHKLTEDGYATRFAECRAAAAALGVSPLCALGANALPRLAALPAPLDRRARHVVTDSLRARDGAAALEAGDSTAFGRLMTESHASQRDDFEITVAETDRLVEAALRHGALGARQTGGGWGGAVVMLAHDAEAEALAARVAADCPGAHLLAIC